MKSLNEAAQQSRALLAQARRIVIKIGTNTLTRLPGNGDRISSGAGGRSDGGIDIEYLHRVALDVADLVRQGKQVIIVTSGAIGMGARELGISKRVSDVVERQACAAIGQPLLMNEYHRAFGVYGLTVAQVLITRDVWDVRSSYLNLRAAVENLLDLRVVPVFNENDALSTAEIGNAFGDNDQLSAYVASKIDAELLLLLSDIDCLYTANPREQPDAQAIDYVDEITSQIKASAGDRGTEFSTGGMKTKLLAVEIARDAGCRVVITHGRTERVISRCCAGEALGTLFEARMPLKNRTRWIKNSRAQGSLTVDEGAWQALAAHNSLLLKGVVEVLGVFDRNSVIEVNQKLKLVTSFSSSELEAAKGLNSQQVAALLGSDRDAIVARPDDMAFF